MQVASELDLVPVGHCDRSVDTPDSLQPSPKKRPLFCRNLQLSSGTFGALTLKQTKTQPTLQVLSLLNRPASAGFDSVTLVDDRPYGAKMGILIGANLWHRFEPFPIHALSVTNDNRPPLPDFRLLLLTLPAFVSSRLKKPCKFESLKPSHLRSAVYDADLGMCGDQHRTLYFAPTTHHLCWDGTLRLFQPSDPFREIPREIPKFQTDAVMTIASLPPAIMRACGAMTLVILSVTLCEHKPFVKLGGRRAKISEPNYTLTYQVRPPADIDPHTHHRERISDSI